MARRYHTLIARDSDGTWTPQFGDYSKAAVREELREFRRDYAAKDLRIIESGETQAEINSAVAAINADWRNG